MTIVEKLNAAFMAYLQALESAVVEECSRLAKEGHTEKEIMARIEQTMLEHKTFIDQQTE